jgi:hypothetical protein
MAALPQWAEAFNTGGRIAEAAHEAHVEGVSHFHELVENTPAANRYELDFARALIDGERLGRGPVTDLVTLSLSANDLIGHAKGPDSEEEHQMILGLDRDLDSFFSWLDKTIGLQNVWITLSADHGVAAVPAQAAQLGIDAATPDFAALRARLNLLLNARFSPQETKNYLLASGDLPYLTLDRRVFEQAHIDERTAEDAAAELLPQARRPAIGPPPAAHAHSCRGLHASRIDPRPVASQRAGPPAGPQRLRSRQLVCDAHAGALPDAEPALPHRDDPLQPLVL